MQDINENEMVSVDGGGWEVPGWLGLLDAIYDTAKGFIDGLSDSSIPYVTSTITYL